MYAPNTDSTTFIAGPFGWRIPRYRPSYSYVYLLHFSESYFHARHYLVHNYETFSGRERCGS